MVIRSRFYSKVDKVPGGCWLWTAAVDTGGYGVLWMGKDVGKLWRAHRVSVWLHQGPVPELVCHTCDVRRCVNPAHLVSGSQAENMADARDRGRTRVGETNHNSKLTAEEVLEIRKLLSAGEKQCWVARRFGVHQVTISEINCGKIWGHLGNQ